VADLQAPGRAVTDRVAENSIGLLATGTNCFLLVCVMSARRVPAPPDGIRAFTRSV